MNALIFGVTGQDGAYLAKLLLEKGYTVFGTSRDIAGRSHRNTVALGIDDDVNFLTVDITDYKSILTALRESEPDEIYNLAGQSSVGVSFALPFETIRSFTLGVLNVMEGIRFMGLNAKLFNASSGECFGETGDSLANEGTAFAPKSPYSVAKASAFWSVRNYRQAYGLYACSGILFSHESVLRNKNFVSKKITRGAARIKKGMDSELVLGNLDIRRDWGWAPEYVEAMWLMLQQEQAEDFVLATGQGHSLQDFVRLSFEVVDLDYRDYLKISEAFTRPSDIACSVGDPQSARLKLGWQAKSHLPDIVKMMVEAELEHL